MTTWEEGKHPRSGSGQFAAKPPSAEGQVELGEAPAPAPDVSELRRQMVNSAEDAQRSVRHQAATAARYIQGCFPGAKTVTTTTGREGATPDHITSVEDASGNKLWVAGPSGTGRNLDVEMAQSSMKSAKAFDMVPPQEGWTSPRQFTPPPNQGFSNEMHNRRYSLDSISELSPDAAQ